MLSSMNTRVRGFLEVDKAAKKGRRHACPSRRHIGEVQAAGAARPIALNVDRDRGRHSGGERGERAFEHVV